MLSYLSRNLVTLEPSENELLGTPGYGMGTTSGSQNLCGVRSVLGVVTLASWFTVLIQGLTEVSGRAG